MNLKDCHNVEDFGKFVIGNVRFNFATSRENISKAIEKIDKTLK